MARNVLACFAVVLVTMMMIGGLRSVAAISCGQIAAGLTPCMKYVREGGRTVPTLCCAGLHALVTLATREGELQAACQCMKQLLVTLPGVNWTYVNSIPVKCGISIPCIDVHSFS
ncbi:lipid transfer protein [Cinnamomum micranthum f. kanehirae]|uniref:Lipid transfer protein n=1 Tax=Cinnamomum micranthum f. kanehirae TaxID=337451 RepID=A0A443NPN7_9MAGN|nr:lipid transfer protein [Cinnamomum micranthum f. kanehirae]